MSTAALPPSGRETPRGVAVAAAVIGGLSMVLIAALIAGSERVTVARVSVAWELPYIAFLVAGAVLAIHRPSHRVGWSFLGLGSLTLLASALGTSALALGGGLWLTNAVPQAITTAAVGGLLPLTLLIFPTGHLLSPAWRWVARIAVANSVVGGLAALINGGWGGWVDPEEEALSPLRDQLGGLGDALASVFSPVFGAAHIACAVCLTVRYRRSRRDEREQLRWLAAAAVILVAAGLLATALTELGVDPGLAELALVAAFCLIPISAGVAVLKYRLYDIDIVISRALVAAALAAFITGVYVAIVVGIGALLGRGGEADPVLTVLAVGTVAVAFQPIRRRLRRLADRLVYGERATPYEVLAGFARATTATGYGGDPLTEVARLLAAGTGASTVTIWLRVGEALRPAASWPAAAGIVGSSGDRLSSDVALPPPGGELVLHEGAQPGEPVVGRTTSVLHAGELLGAVSITKQRSDAVSTIDDQVLSDVAAGLSLILQNRRLVAELADRVDALAASRQRIVSTQDEVRRKLGRDLRVGAAERLRDCRTRLEALATQAATGGATRTAQLIDQIATDTEAAIDVLHDFAGGVYPPVLEAQGPLAALRVATAGAALPVMVQGTVGRRYPREVESAVYFSVLEAVQNAAKYSRASGVTVRLADDGAELSFEVTDDGIGFDPETVARGTGLANITDRLDALGGALTITSSPGQGTVLRGVLPVGVPVPA